MSDTDSDSTNAWQAEEKVVSARSTLRTAEWISDEGQFRSGELPLWNRLQSASKGATRGGRWLARLSWCVVFGLAAIALLRIVWHDGAWPLVLLNAFTLYLYWPAYFVMAFSLATGRRGLLLASVAVIASHITFIWPDLQLPQTRASASQSDRGERSAVRIYYANVHARNLQMEAILAEARRYDPDVIVLVEMQRWWWRTMIARRPLADFPYGTNLDGRNAGDVGVFSRIPVRRFEQIHVAGRTVLVLDLAVEGETLRLFALHSPRPTPDSRDSYFEFWELIGRVVTQQQGPVVVVGDFNATQHSWVYGRLQAGGLRSAHEDRGRGMAMTWPNVVLPFPLIRIDQVFLSPEVDCVSIQEGEAPGSDHRSLVVDVVLQPDVPSHVDR